MARAPSKHRKKARADIPLPPQTRGGGGGESSAQITSMPNVDDWEKVEVEGGDDESTTTTTLVQKKVPKEKEVRVKSSTFHMTINTNQRYPTPEALERDLRLFGSALYAGDGVSGVFQDRVLISQLVEILEPGVIFDDVVGNTSTKIGIEYSATAGLHAHCVMTVVHISKVRIHLKKLRQILDRALPWLAGDAPYVHVQFVPDHRTAVLQYIKKNVGGKTLKMPDGTDFAVPCACLCDCPTVQYMGDFFPNQG